MSNTFKLIKLSCCWLASQRTTQWQEQSEMVDDVGMRHESYCYKFGPWVYLCGIAGSTAGHQSEDVESSILIRLSITATYVVSDRLVDLRVSACNCEVRIPWAILGRDDTCEGMHLPKGIELRTETQRLVCERPDLQGKIKVRWSTYDVTLPIVPARKTWISINT